MLSGGRRPGRSGNPACKLTKLLGSLFLSRRIDTPAGPPSATRPTRYLWEAMRVSLGLGHLTVCFARTRIGHVQPIANVCVARYRQGE